MTSLSTSNKDQNVYSKLKKFQLPHRFRIIGIIMAVLFFIGLFVNAFTMESNELWQLCKYGLLGGMLMISISKEPIEDEYIINLRMQSYTFAFIAGVLYTLAMPLIDFLFDAALKTDAASLKDMGDFQILWILLSIQVLFFEKLKRSNK